MSSKIYRKSTLSYTKYFVIEMQTGYLYQFRRSMDWTVLSCLRVNFELDLRKCNFFRVSLSLSTLKVCEIEMDTFVKLNGSRSGRDKIFRTVQYALKIINNVKFVDLATAKTKDLEKILGSFRKLLRFGTSLDALYAAKQSLSRSVKTSVDPGNDFTDVMAKIANALYLFGDHVVWLHQNNIVSVEDVSAWQRFSDQGWLWGIILNLGKDYKVSSSDLKPTNLKTMYPFLKALSNKSSRTKAVIVDTIKNIADLWIPMTSLSHVNLPPYVVGMMGVTSSVLGILPLLDPTFKC